MAQTNRLVKKAPAMIIQCDDTVRWYSVITQCDRFIRWAPRTLRLMVPSVCASDNLLSSFRYTAFLTWPAYQICSPHCLCCKMYRLYSAGYVYDCMQSYDTVVWYTDEICSRKAKRKDGWPKVVCTSKVMFRRFRCKRLITGESLILSLIVCINNHIVGNL